MITKSIRPIAIYLPQYHPIPENDEWWGKGFTEWTNVTKAKPLFRGHYQPHLPSDLGFYDLRLGEVREAQAKLAKEYGIYGFCYYHYWFNGKRILERPLQEVFESGKPDFPFMVCWANENWTKVWDGGNKEILLAQQYSFEDDRQHIQNLIPYFKDQRYIRINNKPVIAIYRSTILPDVKTTLQIWREEAAKQEIELYICRFESFAIHGEQYLIDGFEAAIDFEPLGFCLQQYKHKLIKNAQQKLSYRIRNRFYNKVVKKISSSAYDNFKTKFKQGAINNLIDYTDFVNHVIDLPSPSYKLYPCVTPMWDNSPRRKKNPIIFHNSNPETYKKWLSNTVSNFKPFSNEENFVFINAWNEWAEGNHLEPCMKWGRQYLEATKEALSVKKVVEIL